MAETKNRFGVPIGDSGPLGIVMPKLKYRFRVSFLTPFAGSTDSKTMTQNIQSVTRPSLTYDEVEIHSYNSKVYVQGKHTWNTIDVAIRDDIANNITKLVGQQVTRQVNHHQQTTTAAASDFKFPMMLEVLDGSEKMAATEQWELEGCFITNVTYGDNDYSATDQQLVTLTIRYDNAIHVDASNNLNGSKASGDMFTVGVPANQTSGNSTGA
jgi:hypothetical protein